MAFKQISDISAETTISLGGINKKTGKANPTSVEGYYLGKREEKDRKKKSGISYLYFLQTAKGNVGVWGKTDMDRKMTSIKEGEMIRITHTGMQATANGDMYKYLVEVDSDNVIEVLGSGEPSFDANEGLDEKTTSNDEDEDTFEQDEVVQKAALSALERKNKVAALLKRK